MNQQPHSQETIRLIGIERQVQEKFSGFRIELRKCHVVGSDRHNPLVGVFDDLSNINRVLEAAKSNNTAGVDYDYCLDIYFDGELNETIHLNSDQKVDLLEKFDDLYFDVSEAIEKASRYLASTLT